ncbi:MAG TPA: DUF4097 family beta strand repeat-containing protein [Bryobacteraceae bacterium]|nr:DUF4097 family beta strand repeat-containing protein [Bryobacteraceae bacterium]
MRRGSIIGPLFLIGLGILFLVNNLRPDLSVWRMLWTTWPYLLILWGVLRLIEILISAARSKPLPQAGVGGGGWFLVFLIALIGSGMTVYHNHVGNFPTQGIRARILGDLGESFDYAYTEQRIESGKTPRVLIENLRGNARIIGVDAPEVKVSGRKTVRALEQSDADSAHQLTPLELSMKEGLVVIRTHQERASGDRRISADLEIMVPRGATVECRGRYGDFDINSIDGSVDVNSDNAGVRVQDVAGDVRVELRRSDVVRAVNVKGAVYLKGRGQSVELENIAGQVIVDGFYTGELHFRNLAKTLRFDSENSTIRVEAVPGEIRMARGYLTARNITGPATFEARNKDIKLNQFTGNLDVRIDRGDIELFPVPKASGRMNVRTDNGDIELSMPEGLGFSIRAQVDKGSIDNEYGSPLRVDESGRGARLEGSTGSGPDISLHSNRGTMTVRKGSPEMHDPPNPPDLPAPPRKPHIPTENL